MAKPRFSNTDALKLFMTCCPEIFKNDEMEIFHKFFCPISIIEADVKEYIIDEYDSVELLILRLYSSGLRNPHTINSLTGIDINMIDKILKTEKYTYGHINPSSGELTMAGKQTLADNNDIENLFKHALYDVKRELQADALTGTIIRSEAEISKNRMSTFSDRIKPNVLPLEAVKIDSELECEIKERLQQYINEGYFSEGNTINDIGNLRTKEIRYREAYFVKLKEFKYPFVAISYFEKAGKVIAPIAISATDALKIEYSKRSKEYLIRADQYFEYLRSNKDLFDNCPELDDEIIRLILETDEDSDDVEVTVEELIDDIDEIEND